MKYKIIKIKKIECQQVLLEEQIDFFYAKEIFEEFKLNLKHKT